MKDPIGLAGLTGRGGGMLPQRPVQGPGAGDGAAGGVRAGRSTVVLNSYQAMPGPFTMTSGAHGCVVAWIP